MSGELRKTQVHPGNRNRTTGVRIDMERRSWGPRPQKPPPSAKLFGPAHPYQKTVRNPRLGRGLPAGLLVVSIYLLMLGLTAACTAQENGEERLDAPVPDAAIEISKARRELRLYSRGELLRRYRVGLGFEPVADKVQEGDGATPEGEFFVCVKNPRSRYHLSLGLNYPNAEDAARGLESKLVSSAQAARIVEADQRRRAPPWNTALGGEIYIHGRGANADWTLGCIALDDPDMEELFAAVTVGTPVTIRP